MFEYDISIALEHASFAKHAIWEIEFPQSCVLYIRNHRSLPDFHEAIVKFTDGQKIRYRVPIIQAKKYTVDRIFEKRLLILLPYHILRYEHFLKHNGTDLKKVQHLLDDFREINRKLEETSEKEQKSHLYMDMIVLIEEIAEYSLGMKQRLAIALAVMHNPNLLILDEPINGLDPIGIAEVRSFIRELCDVQGKTILISSHILSEIELLADDIGIIDKGILLEEESMKELAKKNSRYVNFMVSDSQRAAKILRKEFECDDFQICDKNRLQLYNTTIPRSEITYVFVKQGLEITEVHLCEETLEDYFKRVTGGEGIA